MKRISIVGAGDKAHALNLASAVISPQEQAAARRLIERRFGDDEATMTELLEACGIST